MRTKNLLLAAAALAAGIVTSQAQSNVYSVNIVGYVNKPIPSGYSILVAPFKAGATNGANEIMTPVDGEVILTWNNLSSSFQYVSFDTGFGGWIDSGFNPANPPALPVGKGFFFFNPGGSYTNTFVGEVIPAPGTTNATPLPSGYDMVGSALPAGGPISAAPVSLPLIDGLVLLQWNNLASSYTYSSYDTGFGGWIDSGFNPISEPNVTVGEGYFFFNPGSATTWQQTLP